MLFKKEKIWKRNFKSIDELIPLLKKDSAWKNIDISYMNQIYENSNNDINKMREFLIISDMYDLVENNFIKITSSDFNSGVLTEFGLTLYGVGKELLKDYYSNNLSSDERKETLALSESAFRSALICDKYLLVVYFLLIICCLELKDMQGAIEYKKDFNNAVFSLINSDENGLSLCQKVIKNDLASAKEIEMKILKVINDYKNDLGKEELKNGIDKKTRQPKEIKDTLDILDKLSCKYNCTSFKLVRNEIEQIIFTRSDEFVKMVQNGVQIRQWLYGAIANTAGNLAESGKYHLYRGVINPIGEGKDLIKLFDIFTDELVKMGYVDSISATNVKQSLRESIKTVG